MYSAYPDTGVRGQDALSFIPLFSPQTPSFTRDQVKTTDKRRVNGGFGCESFAHLVKLVNTSDSKSEAL